MSIKNLDLEKAAWFSFLSSLVYKKEAEIKQFFESEGIGNVKFLDKDGTQALMYSSNTEVAVVVRGTEPTAFKDILADLNIRKKKAKADTGKVHAGFQESLDDIWREVILFIDNHANGPDGKDIYFAGHSLGAAVATLAAFRCPRVTELYTFGSPRVGNSTLIKANKEITHWRFVNNNDLVARVPSFLRWTHHGKRVYINHKGKISGVTGVRLFWDLCKGHASSWMRFKFFDSFSDHSIVNYYEHIRNN